MNTKRYFAKFGWDSKRGPYLQVTEASARPKPGMVWDEKDVVEAMKALSVVADFMRERKYVQVPHWLYRILHWATDALAAMQGHEAYGSSWSTEKPDEGKLPGT